MIEKIKAAMENGDLVEKILHKCCFELKYHLSIVSRYYWGLTNRIENGKILFLTFQGDYTCNPKYICNELIRNHYHGRLVWVIDGKKELMKEHFPKEVELVERGTREYYKALYSANIWIDNAFNVSREFVWKKRGQIYIETMHGALGIKRIDTGSVRNRKRNQRGDRCGALTDYIIANSTFEEEVYRTSFWKDTSIWKLGHARNDILLSNSQEKRQEVNIKVREHFHIPPNKKIVLYAPTFKDKKTDVEDLDFERLCIALEKKYGGEWVVIRREHHRDKGKAAREDHNMIDGNDYSDIQEIMLAADVGITDYSSWIFDYMFLRKPAFLCVFDEEVYDKERGFYYPLKETPFLIAHCNDELEENIMAFEQEQYENQIETFLKQRGCYENGNACNRIAKRIERLMEVRK